jgi:hypothetical protein
MEHVVFTFIIPSTFEVEIIDNVNTIVKFYRMVLIMFFFQEFHALELSIHQEKKTLHP